MGKILNKVNQIHNWILVTVGKANSDAELPGRCIVPNTEHGIVRAKMMDVVEYFWQKCELFVFAKMKNRRQTLGVNCRH